ncbi:biotin transporter BioY [Xiamenia xianingshaonis]|uniref:Biotin transporter n=1 Tax=Xiamenia xianingshaonis TaxID=2682776 RepID=A0A9E6MQB5_9ACTN|nr:biotin transporter BioY [Xiamenia xianingshaonis]NHM14867.1 biotin transporter BioY [Xiamenia xianingshaonis]QTU84035.1 biotin transporter BioY [Xiamenia xianingshaonis]
MNLDASTGLPTDAAEQESPQAGAVPPASPDRAAAAGGTAKGGAAASSRTRAMARVALCIAIIAVSAWVTIPLGAVPVTLQIFAVAFAIVVLPPKECLAAIAGYELLGAVGLPVFSGMRGGIGVLLGPTGGYLWGYLVGAALALVVLAALRRALGVPMRDGRPVLKTSQVRQRNLVASIAASLAYVAVAYVCGWAWFMAVMHVGPLESFLATVAPFVIIDLVKVVAAALCAQAVLRAVR